MARVQVGDLSQPEGLEVTVRPNIQTANAQAAPRLEENSAYRLSKALGVAAEIAPKAIQDQTQSDAEAFFNSKTVSEIGKMTRSGELAAQHNPLFVGMVHNLYGQNVLQQNMRDTESRIASGELTFKSSEDLDAYLVKQRNDLLAEYPDNKFVQTGYDKQFNAYRNQVKTKYTTDTSKALISNAEAQVTDALHNQAKSILNPENKLTPEESMKGWMNTYNTLKSTVLLEPEARKNALYDNGATFAIAGRPDLVTAMLDTELDNGTTVRGTIGNKKAESLLATAQNAYEANERQATKIRIKQTQDAATNLAITTISTSLQAGQGGLVPDTYLTLNDNGEPKEEKTMPIKQAILADQVKDLPLAEQIDRFARNNMTNDGWKREIASGASNIYSVGVPVNEKGEVGQLNEVGQQSFGTFSEMYRIDPRIAKQHTPEADFDTFETMYFAVNAGLAKDASEAAWTMNQRRRSGITQADYDSMKKDIKNATEDLASGPWYDFLPFVDHSARENYTALSAQIRNVATYLINDGTAPTGDIAVEKAKEIVTATATRFNGALYGRSQLPTISTGDPADFWMEAYMEDKFNPYLKALPGAQNRYDYRDFYFQPTPNGFIAMQKDGITPLWVNGNKVTVSFKDIENYAKEENSKKNGSRALQLKYKNFRTRMMAENNTMPFMDDMRSGGLGEGQFVPPSFDDFLKIKDMTVKDERGRDVPLQSQSYETIRKALKDGN